MTMHTSVEHETPSQGKIYPLNTGSYAPTGEDRSLCDQRLKTESLRLFQIAGGGINVLGLLRNNESQKLRYQRFFLQSEEVEKSGISQHIQDEAWQHLVFIIEPVFSWSQLSITETAFRNVLAELQVFTPFLQVINAFGAKTNDRQRANDLAYHRFLSSSAYEFCYNIRYFELNGRGGRNPWSLRQTGVYQRCLSSKRSATIMLNSSEYVRDRVTAALLEYSCSTQDSCTAYGVLPHLFILFAATRNWQSYINSLHQKLLLFEEKAYSLRIDESYIVDFKALSSDVQQVMLLSDAISVAASVISRQRGVLVECTNLYVTLHRKSSNICGCDKASTLAMLKADLQHHHEAMSSLARTASKTTQALSGILATRRKDTLLATMACVQTELTELQRQTRQNGLDIEKLLNATAKGHKDTAIMKILAQIATMFLPASLVASLFDSVIFGDSGNEISNTSLYFIIIVPLSFCTLLLLIFLEKSLHVGNRFRHFMSSIFQ